MPASTTSHIKGAAAQRKQAKRATLDMFLQRKPYEAEFEVALGADPDEKVTMLFRSISSVEYDKLIDRCPATKEQLAENASYDQEKFMPMLLSRVCVDPALDQAEWKQILTSDNYGRGEVNELFYSAVGVCNRQLGMAMVNPTGPASE